MSAAIAEPSAEAQQQAVAAETNSQKPITAQNPIKLEIGGIVAGLKKSAGVPDVTKAPESKEVAEKAKTDSESAAKAKSEADAKAKEAVVPKEEKPVVSEAAKDPDVKHNAGHFKVVTDARDAALARVKALETELETARKTPPAEIATKLTDYEKRLADAEKEREELRGKVRQYDVTADPEFERQYTKPVLDGQREVYDLLVQAGTEKNEAARMVNDWDLNAIDQAAEGMNGITKSLVMASVLETQRRAKARQEQITKPEDFQARQRQQQEETMKRSVAERLKIVEEIERGVVEVTPALGDEANIGLLQEMRNGMTRAAKAEMGPKEVIAMVGQAIALQAAVKGQHDALTKMQEQIDALTKERDELNAFVKENGGATLKSEAGGGDGEKGAYVPISNRIVVRT